MSSVVERLEEKVERKGIFYGELRDALKEAIAEIGRLEEEQERRAKVFATLQAVAADLVEENETQEAGLLKYRAALERTVPVLMQNTSGYSGQSKENLKERVRNLRFVAIDLKGVLATEALKEEG